mmetsp:Transcript_28158/g.60393  ORF Transcript_28158/g.60393 Transcript_28158/m.60393 type:complete len:228 (-) Transcript_28158:1606-2289(-)
MVPEIGTKQQSTLSELPEAHQAVGSQGHRPSSSATRPARAIRQNGCQGRVGAHCLFAGRQQDLAGATGKRFPRNQPKQGNEVTRTTSSCYYYYYYYQQQQPCSGTEAPRDCPRGRTSRKSRWGANARKFGQPDECCHSIGCRPDGGGGVAVVEIETTNHRPKQTTTQKNDNARTSSTPSEALGGGTQSQKATRKQQCGCLSGRREKTKDSNVFCETILVEHGIATES